MAPSRFSVYSPGHDPDDGTSLEPRYGAGREQDPGYLASLRGGSVLGQLRRMWLVLVIAPVLILAISPLIVQGTGDLFGGAVPWFCLPLVAAAAAAAVIGPRTPRPMPPGSPPPKAAAAALMNFRQALLVRFALAEGVIVLGLALATTARSEAVFVAGFVLGYPLLLWLSLPTAGRIEGIRRRLEAQDAESHLWAALLATAQPPDRSAYTSRPDGKAGAGDQDPDGVTKS
ncbi:hypothetical protein [Actinomadura sp. 9N407]|uniref:hypothetical protein n=1 Tax=Actinomadura sp. 9N407 TaxID=3375154 RepID=UPI0037AC0D2A